jgi:transcription antitermination factor NusB
MLALQALCLFDALGDVFKDQLSAFLRDTVAYHDLGFEDYPPLETIAFARQLAADAWTGRRRADELVNASGSHWSTARMSPVDRNILRLAIHELSEEADTSPSVIINEAVELARHFAGTESPGFINGVLDAVRRQMSIPPAGPDTPS